MKEEKFIIWDRNRRIINAVLTMREFRKNRQMMGWDLEIVPYSEAKRVEYLKRI